MPEVVKAHVHQFLMGELLRIVEGKSPPSCNEVRNAFIFYLLGLSQFYDADPSLGVVKLLEEFMFYSLPANIESP